MRFPLSKIYRAFPEFDPFPDSECERYIRYAYAQSRLRIGCIPAVAFVVALIFFNGLHGVVAVALESSNVRPGESGEIVIFFVALVSGFAVPAIFALLVRDRVLRRVLLDRVRTARCPSCQFSLLGLPVAEGAVRCPECGTNIVLSMHNLTPQDLEIRRVDELTQPAADGRCPCARCGASLLGAPIEQDCARCKECGHVQHLTGLKLARALGHGRQPDGYVAEGARITVCPTCRQSLIGLPIFDGQACCVGCGFFASVVPRPGDDHPPTESASDAGLRIRQRRAGGTSPGANERGSEGPLPAPEQQERDP